MELVAKEISLLTLVCYYSDIKQNFSEIDKLLISVVDATATVTTIPLTYEMETFEKKNHCSSYR